MSESMLSNRSARKKGNGAASAQYTAVPAPMRNKEADAARVIQKHARRRNVTSKLFAYLGPLGHKASYPARAGYSTMTSAADAVYSQAEELQRALSTMAANKAQNTVEWLFFRNFDFIMKKLSKRIRRTVVSIDPFMFEEGKEVIGHAFDVIWPEVHLGMYEQLKDRYDREKIRAKQEKRREQLQLKAWPDAPELWPDPFHWFRCSLLYAWMPADLTAFGQLRTPRIWPWFVVLLFPLPQYSFFLWMMLYVLIDRHNEYMLTNFAVLFRAAAFVAVGISWSVSGFYAFYRCATGTNDCATAGPGVSERSFESICFFMGRMLVGSKSFTDLVDLRFNDVAARRRKAAEAAAAQTVAKGIEVRPAHVASRSDVELATANGSRLGLRLGVLLGIVAIIRGELRYLDLMPGGASRHDAFDAEATWFTPMLLSFVVMYICELLGTLYGGLYALLRRAVSYLARRVAARARRRKEGPRPASTASLTSATAAAAASSDEADEERGVAPLLPHGLSSGDATLAAAPPVPAPASASRSSLFVPGSWLASRATRAATQAAAVKLQSVTRGVIGRRAVKEAINEASNPSGSRIAPVSVRRAARPAIPCHPSPATHPASPPLLALLREASHPSAGAVSSHPLPGPCHGLSPPNLCNSLSLPGPCNGLGSHSWSSKLALSRPSHTWPELPLRHHERPSPGPPRLARLRRSPR